MRTYFVIKMEEIEDADLDLSFHKQNVILPSNDLNTCI